MLQSATARPAITVAYTDDSESEVRIEQSMYSIIIVIYVY